ncbi:MAG: primosomal protein N' [Elusimicrobiales bacterium]|nr:primosomal protein N' [Elusimicrobiales bacterium]
MFCKVAFPVPLRREFDYAVPENLRAALSPGMRVRVPFGPRAATGFAVSFSDTTNVPAGIKLREISALYDAAPLWPAGTLLSLANFISANWGCTPGEALNALIPPFIKQTPPEELLSAAEKGAAAPPVFELAAAQSRAFDEICAALSAAQRKPALLFGDALSGKTEICVRLLQKFTAGGGQGLLLLPDIALAGNIVETLPERFGKIPVFAWHSRQTAAKRARIWHALRGGQPAVVIGARSACLLPFRDLRLAVLDDEHDDSYKQEENRPHYHAREVLLARARLEGFPLLLSSHAPSVETMRAAVGGDYELVRLKGCALSRGAEAAVRLASKKGAASPVFSDELHAALEKSLAAGDQSLLIINRVGYAGAWSCLYCGYIVPCPKCGRALSPTKEGADKQLLCGHCGEKMPPPEKCPLCQNRVFRAAGSGTQRAAAELKKLFPQARILRFDRETLRLKKGEGHGVYAAMLEDGPAIAVGTRILAHYYFPRLRLAAVLDADTELYGPDFRGAERTCQTIMQVRGRLAARGGELIIQTYRPKEYAIAAGVSGDYMAFAMHEFDARRDLGYPPFKKLARFTAEAKTEEAAASACGEAVARLEAGLSAAGLNCPADYEIAGPAPIPGRRTEKTRRCQFLVKCGSPETAAKIPPLLETKRRKGLVLRITADPYSFR